jgi:hypothetical protein
MRKPKKNEKKRGGEDIMMMTMRRDWWIRRSTVRWRSHVMSNHRWYWIELAVSGGELEVIGYG